MIDYNKSQSAQERFDEAQGGRQHAVVDQHNWLIFPNGARRERSQFGAMYEPPEDPRELWKIIAHYRQAILTKAETAFRQRHEQIMGTSKAMLSQKYVGPLDISKEAAVAELTTLRDAVRDAQAKLNEAREKVEEHRPAHLRELEASSAKNKQAAGELIDAIREIKI
ncbi:MAG: hypothetical protein QM790_20215 [Nibricoccus sp.]